MDLRRVSGPLSPSDREAVRALAARATAEDGVAPLDEAALLALDDDGAVRGVHVLADEGDHVVGYAQVDPGGEVPAAQLVVDPGARRRGVGRALLEAAGDGPLEALAHGDLPAARALAEAAGFVAVHELWRMARDLRHPVAEPVWPAGVVVRAFVQGHDEAAWLAVNAHAFADHPEQGRWDAHDLRAREREPWFDPDGFLLAERDGTLQGFAWTKVHPAGELADGPVGELYVVGVDPSAQGAGLGKALTAAGIAHLVGRGLGTAVLWVAGDNAAAVRTYRNAGFERAGTDVRYARDDARGASEADGATMGA